MITYLYWFLVIVLTLLVLYLFAGKLSNWPVGLIGAVLVLAVGSLAYFFHFQQIFVKRWGGVMSVAVPEGQRHISATWKDENLWIENYDPASNTCIFSEYSKGSLLEGQVKITNCMPVSR